MSLFTDGVSEDDNKSFNVSSVCVTASVISFVSSLSVGVEVSLTSHSSNAVSCCVSFSSCVNTLSLKR